MLILGTGKGAGAVNKIIQISLLSYVSPETITIFKKLNHKQDTLNIRRYLVLRQSQTRHRPLAEVENHPEQLGTVSALPPF